MKLAVIAPPQGEKLVEKQGYNLALAQYILRDEDYLRMMIKHRHNDHFIMLDNGAAEGEIVTPEELITAANMIDADEVLLIDELKDPIHTVRWHLDSKILNAVPPRYRAVIPQGSTWEEWKWCLNEILVAIEFNTLCLPKHLERLSGGRKKAMRYLATLGLDRKYDIHLLGCQKNPIKEINDAASETKWIRGIDTAAPVAYAQKRLPIDGRQRSSLEWHERIYLKYAKSNIQILKEVAHESTKMWYGGHP